MTLAGVVYEGTTPTGIKLIQHKNGIYTHINLDLTEARLLMQELDTNLYIIDKYYAGGIS